MTKHFNEILIARGNRTKYITQKGGTVPYGEIFYDSTTKGVYLSDENQNLTRFGGFDSLVIKGAVNQTNMKDVAIAAEPGDAYIVDGPIPAKMFNVAYDGQGNVFIDTNKNSTRTYDDFYKKGQIIIFVGNKATNGETLTDTILATIPNTYLFSANEITNPNGVIGCVVISGAVNAVDIEYDPSVAEIPNTEPKTRDVQTALDWLFNHKIEYVGTANEISIVPNTSYESTDSAYSDLWNKIAQLKKLKKGEMTVFNGTSRAFTVSVAGVETTLILRTNTIIIKNDETVYTIPMGVSDALNSDVELTGGRLNAGTDIAKFETTTRTGERKSNQVDRDVATVQNAIDMLHQTKADLTATGKVPLSQIPSTMIGALQYIGTLTIPEQGWRDTMSAIEFAKLMSAVKGGWEKKGEGGGSLESALKSADEAYATLDEGDYVIVNIDKKTSNNNKSKQVTTEITITDGNTESPTTLFKVSSGDHVIINEITFAKSEAGTEEITAVTLDHLNSSAAVDAVNGIQGSVIIDNSTRQAHDKDGNQINDITDIQVNTSLDQSTITLSAPNLIATNEKMERLVVPRATGISNTVVASDLKIIDGVAESEGASNTKLVGKMVIEADPEIDGSIPTLGDVTIEFPSEDGKIAIVKKADPTKPSNPTVNPSNPNDPNNDEPGAITENPENPNKGFEDVLAKFNAEGNMQRSEVLQRRFESGQGTLFIGVKKNTQNPKANLAINYDDLANLIQTTVGEITSTRRFDDLESDNKRRTDHTKRQTYQDNVYTILDTDSIIDCGEW